jgi:hypothetical protein
VDCRLRIDCRIAQSAERIAKRHRAWGREQQDDAEMGRDGDAARQNKMKGDR